MTVCTLMRRAVYPGSFNPPTIAHLAIIHAAREQRALDRVDLVVSRRALAKEHVEHPPFEDRIEVLRASVADLGWVQVEVTSVQLIADIADGYDVVILGADKWVQIQDVSFYESTAHRDDALARLPELAIAARPPHGVPPEHQLDIDAAMATVSSTAARHGARQLMTAAARAYDDRTGAWR